MPRTDVTYRYKVIDTQNYEIEVRIANHQKYGNIDYQGGTCPIQSKPTKNRLVWKTHLGNGSSIKGTYLKFESYVIDRNSDHNNVSSLVFINNEKLTPVEGKDSMGIEENSSMAFRQIVEFI
jgi:hypothetical protein